MQHRTRRLTRWLALPIAFALTAAPALAQTWPSQPIKIVAPFPPGGTIDQISRMLQPHLQQALGQSIIIENRSGASGSIGTATVAKSPPDGNTWVFVFDTHGVNPSLIPNMPFDTLKDLAPVMLIGTGAMVITAHSTTPYKTYGELLQAARAKPGSISYGSIGSGSLAHLAMTALGSQLKVEWTHEPYKGGGPLATDGAAGHVPITMATYALWAPHLASGRIRALAVTSPARMKQLPDVPTIAESGSPGFDAQAWWGVLAPAGTPQPIIARMNAELAKSLKIPVVQERLAQMGVDVASSSPDELGKFVANEVAKWGKVVRDHKIKAGE
jgi:tripartite-type tricarboxylate transporter receptor subunit TctC